MTARPAAARILAFCTAALFCVPAHALLFRAYVASTGSDANPCTLPQPCRLLPAALSAIAPGGEIWMLDSANYNTGPVVVDRSASILAVPGALGSLVTNGGPALSVAVAGIDLAVRNVVIAPLAGTAPQPAISVNGGSSLVVENSVIANVGTGLSLSGTATAKVVGTVIRNTAGYAVYLSNGASADLSDTQLLGNPAAGIVAHADAGGATTLATVTRCLIVGGTAAVIAETFGVNSAVARVNITRSTIANASTAFQVSNDTVGSIALIAVDSSTAVDAQAPWAVTGPGAALNSSGDNAAAFSGAGSGTRTVDTLL